MLVPSQIIAILNTPGFDPARLTSIEMVLSLGAPLHKQYKDRLNELLPRRFYELYGLTEGFMMDPEASVSALVIHHPQARYFAA